MSVVKFNSVPVTLANVRISDRHGENPDFPPFRLVGDNEIPLYTFDGSVKCGKEKYVNFRFNVWGEEAEDLNEQNVIQPGTYIQVSGSIVGCDAYETKNGDLGASITVEVDRLVPPYNGGDSDGAERPRRGGATRRGNKKQGARRGGAATRSSGGGAGRRTGNRTSGGTGGSKARSGGGAGRYGGRSNPPTDDGDGEDEDEE